MILLKKEELFFKFIEKYLRESNLKHKKAVRFTFDLLLYLYFIYESKNQFNLGNLDQVYFLLYLKTKQNIRFHQRGRFLEE